MEIAETSSIVATDQAVSPVKGVIDRGSMKELVAVDKLTFKPYRLSLAEKLVCEVMVRTGNSRECTRVVKERYGRVVGERTLRRWMERPAVREYMMGLLELEGMKMTEVEWEARVADAARGDKRLNGTTPLMYKLYAEKKGWMKEREKGNNFVGKNIQVQIVQQDGKI